MKHEVGRSVSVTLPGSIDVHEYSRAVSMGSDNSAMFEVWYKFATPASDPSLEVKLEGSNDLAQWTDLSLTSTTTGAGPKYSSQTLAAATPWQFVRLRYVLGANTGTGPLSVSFATAITTFEEG